MELEEYKILNRQHWTAAQPVLQASTLEGLVRNAAPPLSTRLINSLRLEMMFALLFVLAMIGLLAWSDQTELRIFASAMILYAAIFLIYLARLYKVVLRFDATRPVKLALQQLITIFAAFIRVYYQLILVMIPVIILLGFTVGLKQPVRESLSVDTLIHSSQAWLYLLISLGWYAMMYSITRWYTRKFYGKHLAALRRQLAELER